MHLTRKDIGRNSSFPSSRRPARLATNIMKLSDLGFDQWFEAHISSFHEDDRSMARISAVDRGSYLIKNELNHHRLKPVGSKDPMI